MAENCELNGRCLCGANRYTVTGTPIKFLHCHCSRCRRLTGTGHATNLLLQPASVKWDAPAETRGSYRVPDAKRFASHFCRECGGPLPRDNTAMELVVVPAGTLDSEPPLAPQARIFADSATAWSCRDELPFFDKYPN